MCAQIVNVEVDEQGPALLRIRQRAAPDELVELDHEDPYLERCREVAFEALLAEGRRLPFGSIEVVIGANEYRQWPSCEAVGRAIARCAA